MERGAENNKKVISWQGAEERLVSGQPVMIYI
jgi:hypothetical protein